MAKIIRLSTFENSSFKTIRDITDEEFESLKRDSDIIKSSYSQFVVFKYLQININDYGKFLTKITDVPLSNIDMNIFTDVHFVLHVNKFILNVLVSFKFFLDNAETFLKRTYGKDNEIVLNFKRLLSKHYDDYFAYRFLSRLRHFSLHLGFPLTSVAFDIITPKHQFKNQRGNFKLDVDISILKKEKDLFGNMHKEICEMDDDIDLIPLIHSLSKSILEIQKYIYTVQKDELTKCIENISPLLVYKTKGNQIKVFYDLTQNEDIITFHTYDIPLDIIEELQKAYQNDKFV